MFVFNFPQRFRPDYWDSTPALALGMCHRGVSPVPNTHTRNRMYDHVHRHTIGYADSLACGLSMSYDPLVPTTYWRIGHGYHLLPI
jgi:hypothetical protein